MQLAEHLPLQPITAGAGPEFHRNFVVDLDVSEIVALKALHQLMANPNVCAPQLLARFEKIKGEDGKLQVGDEFDVHLLLSTSSPVRVSHVDRHGFTLKTLSGHLEAGEARVNLKQNGPESFRLEVEILIRSRDRFIDMFYDKIPLARIVQSVLWIEFCENFVFLAHEIAKHPKGEPVVKVATQRKAEATHHWETLEDDLHS